MYALIVSPNLVFVRSRILCFTTAQLPSIVNQTGITITKQNPNFVLAVNLYSPDGSIDPVTLSNYAYLQLVDPLKRLAGGLIEATRISGKDALRSPRVDRMQRVSGMTALRHSAIAGSPS